MKKWVLRIRLGDEMLIDTITARDKNEAFSKFIYRHFTELADMDGAYINQAISEIGDVDE